MLFFKIHNDFAFNSNIKIIINNIKENSEYASKKVCEPSNLIDRLYKFPVKSIAIPSHRISSLFSKLSHHHHPPHTHEYNSIFINDHRDPRRIKRFYMHIYKRPPTTLQLICGYSTTYASARARELSTIQSGPLAAAHTRI